jgi:Sec7-like guanine-nucleotide exchange factor
MRVDFVSIRSTDFPKNQKELATAFGDVLNPFMSQVSIALAKNLTVDENLPFEFKSIQVKVNSSGIPVGNSTVNTDLKNFKGYVCINASNDDVSGSYVTAAPFLTTQVDSGIVTIKHITGLVADTTYTLVLMGIS